MAEIEYDAGDAAPEAIAQDILDILRGHPETPFLVLINGEPTMVVKLDGQAGGDRGDEEEKMGHPRAGSDGDVPREEG